jgi:hypothetical protein
MKKKVSILFTVIFMSSIINLNAKSEINSLIMDDPYTCWDVADATVSAFQAANLIMHHIATYEAEYNVWEAAYDACMG